VIKGVMVTNIDAVGVTFKHGDSSEVLAAKTMIWAGGVMATTFGRKLAEPTKAETGPGGRIKVNRDLTVPNFPDIVIVGDLAHADDQGGNPLPVSRQVAMQAERTRQIIRARPCKGRKSCRHFIISIRETWPVSGRAAAVANISWYPRFRAACLADVALHPLDLHRGV